MAFFKFRKSREEQASAKVAPAQSIEAMRRRAMHRLIGAAVLVLAAVIGFPLVFDNQPRPIPVDLPIEIADKASVKPLVLPPPVAGTAPVASGVVQVAPQDKSQPTPPATKSDTAAAAKAQPVEKVEMETEEPEEKPAPRVAAKPAEKGAEKPEAAARPDKLAEKPSDKAAEKPSDKVAEKAAEKAAEHDKAAARLAEAAKAKALLEGKVVVADASASENRFVVQVGAFADAAKVREVRQKVEGAGLKTYTQVVQTKDGSRTRIRVGPFADKAHAGQAAEKIRKLDLAAVILTL